MIEYLDFKNLNEYNNKPVWFKGQLLVSLKRVVLSFF